MNTTDWFANMTVPNATYKQEIVSYTTAYGIGQTMIAEFFAKETQPLIIEEGLGLWNRLVSAVNKQDDLLANLYLDDLANYCK